jgi:hypothetical protein
MEQENFLSKVDEAIRMVYTNDRDLLGLKVNERAIAHRLAVYLERAISGKEVDCEYNRYGSDLGPKTLPGIKNCSGKKETDWIIPDIIIHLRKSKDKDNLAVFEIKSHSKLDDCDKRKLEGLTSKEGRFKYDFGVGIEFHSDQFKILLFVDGAPQLMAEGTDEKFGKNAPKVQRAHP